MSNTENIYTEKYNNLYANLPFQSRIYAFNFSQMLPLFNIFSTNEKFFIPQFNLYFPIFNFQPSNLCVDSFTLNNGTNTKSTNTDESKDKDIQVSTASQEAAPKLTDTYDINLELNNIEEMAANIQKTKNSNIQGLKPYMKEKIVLLDQKAKELGYTMVIADGYRSHASQISIKKRKPHLAATPGRSPHEYGVAADIHLYKNGKKVRDIKKQVPEFGLYAQSIGLEWGANWKSKYEPWHFNIKNWTELADVRDKYMSRKRKYMA